VTGEAMAKKIVSFVLATCEECGVQAKINVKASGTKEQRPAIALTCQHPPVAQCPFLTKALSLAQASLRAVR
jgi:hypothetical protein